MVHGIFLEECFRRILEANLDQDGYIADNNKINSLLSNNIFGVDINAEAIEVSIFSLYLTIMDYKNPKTLQDYKFPDLRNNLLVSDFFDKEIDKTRILPINSDPTNVDSDGDDYTDYDYFFKNTSSSRFSQRRSSSPTIYRIGTKRMFSFFINSGSISADASV